MEWRADEFQLSSGKVFSANRRLIGISPTFEISGGYDETIDFPEAPELFANFTKEERIELGNYMITLWSKFKQI